MKAIAKILGPDEAEISDLGSVGENDDKEDAA